MRWFSPTLLAYALQQLGYVGTTPCIPVALAFSHFPLPLTFLPQPSLGRFGWLLPYLGSWFCLRLVALPCNAPLPSSLLVAAQPSFPAALPPNSSLVPPPCHLPCLPSTHLPHINLAPLPSPALHIPYCFQHTATTLLVVLIGWLIGWTLPCLYSALYLQPCTAPPFCLPPFLAFPQHVCTL